MNLNAITLQSDVKEMFAAKSPIPPALKEFEAHLHFLMRLAEINDAVYTSA